MVEEGVADIPVPEDVPPVATPPGFNDQIMLDMVRAIQAQAQQTTAMMATLQEQMRQQREEFHSYTAGAFPQHHGARPTVPKIVNAKEQYRGETFIGSPGQWHEFSLKLRSWLVGIEPIYIEAMDYAIGAEVGAIELESLRYSNPEYADVATQLYSKLTSIMAGEPLAMTSNVLDQNGLKVWKALKAYYDPNTPQTRRQLLGQILNPGRVDSLDKLNLHMERWLEKRARYEIMAGKPIEEEYLIGIAVEMCPDKLREFLDLHASQLRTFKEVREEIQRQVTHHISVHVKPGTIGEYAEKEHQDSWEHGYPYPCEGCEGEADTLNVVGYQAWGTSKGMQHGKGGRAKGNGKGGLGKGGWGKGFAKGSAGFGGKGLGKGGEKGAAASHFPGEAISVENGATRRCIAPSTTNMSGS